MLNILEIQTKLVEAALPSGHERACGELLAELAKGRNVEVEKMTETDIPVVEGEKEFMALV